eukprot:5088419-Pyramimonas_sp.AAC.1
MARRCLSVHGLAVVSRRRVPNRDINVALSFIIGYSETRNPNPNPNPNPLSSVMDDNKMLTLASNERIPLRACMRLIVETAHLTNATPATVSRGGVLYLNAGDIGWAPFARSCPLHLSNASVTAAGGPLCPSHVSNFCPLHLSNAAVTAAGGPPLRGPGCSVAAARRAAAAAPSTSAR